MEKTVNFYEIYDYYYQPLLQRSYFKYSLLVLLLIGFLSALFIVVRFFLARKKQVQLLPWHWAFKSLNDLSLDNVQSKVDFKNFYFELTSILKQYLNKRFGWDTIDKTDDELIQYLKIKNLDSNLLNIIQNIAQEAVWIKFANQDALKLQAKKDLDAAYQLIKQTTPNKDDIKHDKI
ncbi:hypothetical protein GF322_01245 [Candidatus Dependentiae bacterium]|nr:hypothetical protein [Candidatus Dependentiae bacterium]